MSDQDRRSLLLLLDAMDDHFDQRISDEEFKNRAASTRESLNPSAARDPVLAASIHALEDFLSPANDGPLPTEVYDSLRTALADLEEPL